jgi:hypothetical protein
LITGVWCASMIVLFISWFTSRTEPYLLRDLYV